MIKSNKVKLIILTLVIILFDSLFLIFSGNTYTYKIELDSNIKKIDNLKIELEKDNIIEIKEKKIDNGILKLKIKSLNRGNTFIDVTSNEFVRMERFYVHNFGIITQESYFGKCTNDTIIPISVFIYVILLIYFLIKKYKKNIKIDIYQYKNITYMGTIIFLFSFLIDVFIQMLNYRGLEHSIERIIYSVSFFSYLIFPIAFIVSIFVIISNLVLLKKEGKSLKNTLGILLSIFIIIITIAPEFIDRYLQTSTIINIHNERGFTLYIYKFFITTVFICLSYLECILLGTIVLGIKSAKHIPSFDKDFIIILGCKIKKDGTLTPLLRGRVDRAIEFAKMQKEKTNKDIVFIPSGGKGSDEIIAEGDAIKNYLVEQGIDKNKIIVENKSKNTYENIKFSNNIIKKEKKNSNIAFSTTNYHVFRAGNLAFNQNIKIEGIGSKTKSYFWINAFIREFVATINSERKKHIKTILIIILISILIIFISYLNAIL